MTLYQYSGSGFLISESPILNSNKLTFSSTDVDFSSNLETFNPVNVIEYKVLEGISYSYNRDSLFDDTDDYGSITDVYGLSADYESITQSSGPTTDYGVITANIVGTLATPFGSLTIGGSAITQPNYRLFLSGRGETKVTYSPDNISGTLFGIGQKEEKRSYAYNESSAENTELDYGLISQIATQDEDYQEITSPGILVEYGLITESVSGIIQPFGKLTLSGSAITQSNYRLFFSGQAVVKTSYIPQITYGTLFGFGQKIESTTFSYNLSSTYENSVDYGLITSLQLGGPDYGLISSAPGTQIPENYGLISESVTPGISLPFGSISISGSVSNIQLTASEVGVGTITLSGELLPPNIDFTPSLTLGGTIHISGTSIESVRNDYVASGSLFTFGEKVEKVTYDYNEQSITTNSLDDFGSISGISTESYDYGLITSIVDDGIDNYGRIVSNPFDSTPFGTITLSGSSLESFDEGPYTTSGSIFVFSGSAYAESFTADTPDNTQLFQISGSALTSDIDVYIGIGTLFKFGEKVESVTYDYNESSIGNNEDDYGLIIDLNPQFSDYGLITGSGGTQPDENYGLITEIVTNPLNYPFGSLFISGTLVEKETDSYVGLGTIFLSNQNVVPIEIDSYSGSGSIIISGTAIEKDVDSYVGFGTLTISDSVAESEVEIYTGSGTISLSGIATERVTFNPPENTQLFQISGTVVEKDVDSYSGLGTIFISGELVHPNIDYTPHYGIDKNIGIGTTGIQLYGAAFDVYSAQTPENTQLFTISGIATERVTFDSPENTQLFQISGGYSNLKDTNSYVGLGTLTISGSAIEKDVDSYVGTGTVFYISGEPLYSQVGFFRGIGIGTFSGTALESESEVYVGLGTISIDIFSRNYSPIYPKNSGIVGSGIGTIRINDDRGLTITRAVLPYFTRGTIFVSGGADESFSESNYPGTGLFTISGIASTREIAVYTAVGFGTIVLSQTGIDKDIDSYVASGSITLSGSTVDISTKSYFGAGTISCVSGAAESFSAQTPDNTQLFNISGSAAEVYSAQTPETEVLYQFNGNLVESRTYGYKGSGQATFGSAAITIFRPRVFGVGLFRFTTHLSDNLYDTCDSVDVTSDYLDSAFVKFVANPPETTILFNLSGSALTKEIQVYASSGSGIVGISISSVLKKTKSFVGIGTLTLGSTSIKKDIDSYVGSGSITLLSGSAETKVSVIPSSTILFSFSGSASTKVSKLKRYVGVGTAYFSGSSSTKVLSRPSYSGIGTIFLSGELVYPNIKYIPTPKGSGVITINGSGLKNLSREYISVTQPLFVFSGGFESFSETGYIGVGTIYIQSTSASTINNPYQIPRIYVTII